MDEDMQATRPAEEITNPEAAQLLRLLEMQSATRRERASAGGGSIFQGGTFRWGSLVVIIAFAVASVVALEWMASQLKSQRSAPAANPAVETGANP